MILSVVIPTYNRPEVTQRAVVSALNQTRPPEEIIVVDDASEPPFGLDASGIIDDGRVRVVRLPANSGASAARQTGVDVARGDVVAFLDSDDFWFPEKLAAQVTLLEKSKSVLTAVSCGWLEEGSRPVRRIPVPGGTPAEFASGCWFAPGSTVVIPKAAFEIVGPFDPNLRRLEDLDWFLRFGLLSGRLVVAPMVGASISIGRRGRGAPVEQASLQILDRFSATLEPALRQRLAAYLELERAVAARNDGRYRGMAFHLARSFIQFPRFRLHLQRWWEEQGA